MAYLRRFAASMIVLAFAATPILHDWSWLFGGPGPNGPKPWG